MFLSEETHELATHVGAAIAHAANHLFGQRRADAIGVGRLERARLGRQVRRRQLAQALVWESEKRERSPFDADRPGRLARLLLAEPAVAAVVTPPGVI